MEDTDLLLVERSGTSYKLETQNMSNLRDDDLLLVERAGVSYKVTADQVNNGPTGFIDQPVEVLTPLNGEGLNAGEDYQPLSKAITAVGTGGSAVYETDTIASVETYPDPGTWTVSGGNILDNTIWEPVSQALTDQIAAINSTQCFTPVVSVDDVKITTENIRVNLIWDVPAELQVNATWKFINPGTDSGKECQYSINGGAMVRGDYCNQQQGTSHSLVVYTGVLTKLNFYNYNSGSVCYGIWKDDKQVVLPKAILTFPTSNNFDKFEVGDVVQDGGWNQSQEWSSTVVSSNTSYDSSLPYSAIWDGIIWKVSTPISGAFGAFGGAGQASTTLTFPNISCDSLTLIVGVGAGTANVDYTINGTISSSVSNSVNTLSYVNVNLPTGTLSSIYLNSTNGLRLYGFMINGKLLVDKSIPNPDAFSITGIDAAGPTISTDGGSWAGADGSGDAGDGRYEPSEEWSARGTVTSGSIHAGRGIDQLFNGLINNSDPPSTAFLEFGGPFPSVVTFSPAITANNSIKLWLASYDGYTSGKLIINGSNVDTAPVPSNGTAPILVDLGVTSLTSLGVRDSQNLRLCALEVDGLELIDSSIPGGAGSTDITKTVTSEASLTFTDDTELANMVGPLTMVDENGEVKTPVTSTIASVGPDVWSTLFTMPSGYSAAIALGFDGDINTYFNPANSSETITFTPSTDILLTEDLQFYNPVEEGTLVYSYQIAGGSSQNGFGTGSKGWKVLTGSAGSTIGPSNPLTIDNSQGATSRAIKWSQFKLNGSVLIDNQSILTFTTPNPDLQYFEVGDVVQQSDGYITPTADRLAESISATQTFNGNNATGSSVNMANYFGLDYNTTGGIMTVKNNLQTFRAEMVLNEPEFVDDDIWTKKPTFNQIDYKYGYVRFVMPDGSTQVVRGGASTTGPAGETGDTWFVIRNRPSDYIDLCYIEFTSAGMVASVPFYGWAVGTRGITLNPYVSTLASVVSTDITNNTMTVEGGVWEGSDGSGVAWNQSATWSVNGDNSVLSSGSWAQMFDGVLNDTYNGSAAATSSGSQDAPITLPVSIPAGTIEFWGCTASSNQTNADGTFVDVYNGDTLLVTVPINWTTTVGPKYSDPVTTTSAADKFILRGFASIQGVRANGQILVNSDVSGGPETQVTSQPLVATANDVNYLDGNTLGVSNVFGAWLPGLYAQGAEVTAYAPSPESIVFTSMNGGTTPFTGTDATLTSRTWTLEKGNSAVGPWTEAGTYIDFAANESQDGASPWDNPDLEPNKFYQVKVRYDSNNADYRESTFNTFKTGDA